MNQSTDDFRMMEGPPPPAGYFVMDKGPYTTRWPISKWPNPWRRFWIWFILGWRFERNDKT